MNLWLNNPPRCFHLRKTLRQMFFPDTAQSNTAHVGFSNTHATIRLIYGHLTPVEPNGLWLMGQTKRVCYRVITICSPKHLTGLRGLDFPPQTAGGS